MRADRSTTNKLPPNVLASSTDTAVLAFDGVVTMPIPSGDNEYGADTYNRNSLDFE